MDIPDIILQRYACPPRILSIRSHISHSKEITLTATQYEPYPCLKYEARYDGVVQTRKLRGSRYELGVFEASSKFRGTNSEKWKKDRTKLLAGCRAMLYRLQESVNYDPDTVKKLQVVGVLQAGKFSGRRCENTLPYTDVS